MKNCFVKTTNVKRFVSLMNTLKDLPPNVPKMALVYGDHGLGKSQTIMWWVTNNDAIYVRCSNNMTGRWLLAEIAEELDESPYYQQSDLFKQIVGKLQKEPKILVIDEVDYLLGYSKTIETLRDLYDKTNIPVVLVGMGMADRKLARFKHIYDRVYQKLKFEPLTNNDIDEIISTLAGIEFTPEAKDFLGTRVNQFRQLVKVLNKLEKFAKTNALVEIDVDFLKEVFNSEE